MPWPSGGLSDQRPYVGEEFMKVKALALAACQKEFAIGIGQALQRVAKDARWGRAADADSCLVSGPPC